jgi:hypothetical protein
MQAIAGAGDLDSDGVPDVMALHQDTGRLYAYPLTKSGGFKEPYVLATGLFGVRDLIGPGSWDAGSTADVLVRMTDGRLLMMAGTGPGSVLNARQVGSGWNGFGSMAGVGDVTADGLNDLVAVSETGDLWVYPGRGDGGFLAAHIALRLPEGSSLW